MLNQCLRPVVMICVIAMISAACAPSQDPELLFARGDYRRALPLFAARADDGDLNATNYLGVQYYLGLGVERDHPRAVKLFQQAAVGDHAGAQRNLGIMYLRGFGVLQDKVRAYSWFYQASEEGDGLALKYLNFVADYITPNQSMAARRWVKEFMRDARS